MEGLDLDLDLDVQTELALQLDWGPEERKSRGNSHTETSSGDSQCPAPHRWAFLSLSWTGHRALCQGFCKTLEENKEPNNRRPTLGVHPPPTLPEDVWQCLERFGVVTTKWEGSQWHFASGDPRGNHTSYNAFDSQPPSPCLEKERIWQQRGWNMRAVMQGESHKAIVPEAHASKITGGPLILIRRTVPRNLFRRNNLFRRKGL